MNSLRHRKVPIFQKDQVGQSVPLVSESEVYVAAQTPRHRDRQWVELAGIERATLDVKWRVPADMDGLRPIAQWNSGRLFVGGYAEIGMIDLDSHAFVWRRSTPFARTKWRHGLVLNT